MSLDYNVDDTSNSNGDFVNIYMDKDQLDSIALKVIEYDKPAHILPLVVVHNTDDILIRYDYSDVEKVEIIKEGIDSHTLIEILSKLCNLLCNCKYWFLDASNFFFNKKHIFYNRDSKQLKLMYLPTKESSEDTDIKDLLLYLVEIVEFEDSDKFKIGILQQMVKPNFNAYKLQKFLKQYSNSLEKKNKKRNQLNDKEDKLISNKSSALKRKKRKSGFLSWLFKSEPIKVGEAIDVYEEKNDYKSKYYLKLVSNETIHKLDQVIELNFLDDTFLIGKKGVEEKDNLLKYNLNNKINEIEHIHLKFIKHKNKLKVVDLESSFGTFINGKRINSREIIEIKEGDNISLSPKITYKLKSNKR